VRLLKLLSTTASAEVAASTESRVRMLKLLSMAAQVAASTLSAPRVRVASAEVACLSAKARQLSQLPKRRRQRLPWRPRRQLKA
jgi:hypothetical protein